MRKIATILILVFLVNCAFAQSQADVQKAMKEAQKRMDQIKSNPQYQQAMQKAQQEIQRVKSDTFIQKQMKEASSKLDQEKKANPALANISMPSLDSLQIPKLPNFDSINARLDKSFKMANSINNAIDQSVPKQNLMHHADKLKAFSSNDIKALAEAQLKKSAGKLDAVLLQSIKKVAKDTSINGATLGSIILATGGDNNAAAYLIFSSILKHPEDEWAINDLGVYYRDRKGLELALQCYVYANKLNQEKSTTINVNIGWAAAYYGDFTTALTYFDKALAIDNDCQTANEGEALIAYAKGDIAALFQCLAKNIKYLGGAGGPSTSFTRIACTKKNEQLQQQSNNPTSDPSNDHTFDNGLPDEAPNTPPGADVDNVTLSQFKKVFVAKPEEVGMGLALGVKQVNAVFKQLVAERKRLTSQLSTLKPLGQKPYVDEEGYVIYPSNFEKYVIPLTPIKTSFENRLVWSRARFNKKLAKLKNDIKVHNENLYTSYYKELAQCSQSDNDSCEHAVECKWFPILYASANDDLESLSQIWKEYYQYDYNAVNWYLQTTAPYISRVHQIGWNDYLNAERVYLVKTTYYELYANWVTGLNVVAGMFSAGIPEDFLTCSKSYNSTPKDPPDPFSKKPKHIKEFEGKCFNFSFDIQVGTIQADCHQDKFQFGNEHLNLCYTHITDPIAAQNQGYAHNVNFTASVEKEITLTKIAGKEVAGKVGVQGNMDMKFDSDGNFTSGSSSVSAAADVGHVHLGDIEASRTATAKLVSGQRQIDVSALSVNANGPSIK